MLRGAALPILCHAVTILLLIVEHNTVLASNGNRRNVFQRESTQHGHGVEQKWDTQAMTTHQKLSEVNSVWLPPQYWLNEPCSLSSTAGQAVAQI